MDLESEYLRHNILTLRVFYKYYKIQHCTDIWVFRLTDIWVFRLMDIWASRLTDIWDDRLSVVSILLYLDQLICGLSGFQTVCQNCELQFSFLFGLTAFVQYSRFSRVIFGSTVTAESSLATTGLQQNLYRMWLKCRSK